MRQVLEDDLHLAVDFLELFLSTAHLLEDPSIFCISGWNDQGIFGRVRDETRLFRTNYFPGLGWMLRRQEWKVPTAHKQKDTPCKTFPKESFYGLHTGFLVDCPVIPLDFSGIACLYRVCSA